MANSQHKYLLERGWSQQQIDEVIRKAHEWLRGAGYTPLTEQGHWNGIMGSTQSYHLPSREKDARGMTEAFVEMLKGGKILDASRVHKFSRPGEKDMMAREVVARKGSKRVELSGPQADGRWVVTVMQEEKQVVPGEANDRFVESKFYSTEAGARRAASKILASRPGEKAVFAETEPMNQFKVGQVVKVKVATGVVKGTVVRRIYDSLTGGERYLVEMPSQIQRGKMQAIAVFPYQIRASRPGAKATFKVEDRFYFGKGRKERFELSFNRAEVERAKSELRSLVDVHRRLASKSEGVKAAKHGVIADVLARLINQGPEVLAAIGFRKASYWNARAMELANASSSGYGPILKTLISEAEREYRSH